MDSVPKGSFEKDFVLTLKNFTRVEINLSLIVAFKL